MMPCGDLNGTLNYMVSREGVTIRKGCRHVVYNLKGLRKRRSCNRNKGATVVRIGVKYQTKE